MKDDVLSKEGYAMGAEKPTAEQKAESCIEDEMAKKSDISDSGDKTTDESTPDTLPLEKKPKTNRCLTCRKKVGLLGK